ncbi:hypothetical protein M9Y10_024768 [Tritrichomonas musculus]|uniref:3'-5' exonuclease domain-containing protein n=1 Tax=Tritrichomonas musculus TaxID=1915356 RepID=A0ABR2HC48_9EUKA
MEFPEIHFGGDNPKLHSYKKYYWQPGETRIVEFYPGKNTQVTLLYSSDPSLFEKLTTLIDGNPISIDLEWAPPNCHSPHPVELFQFSSSKGTIIVASQDNKGYDQIARFLHSSTFFGKGMSCDKKKLHECTNETFDEIEDIEQTRLSPNKLPLNFESLTKMFLGEGTAKFKDHKVQVSDWSQRPLTIQQILYGAHDSYAMLNVYYKIVEKYRAVVKQTTVNSKKKAKNKKKKSKPQKVPQLKIECVDIDWFFTSKNMSIDYVLVDAESIEENMPSLKHLLFDYERKKGVEVTDEDSCFLDHPLDVIDLLLPGKTKDKKTLCLERIMFTGDLFLLGIVHAKRDNSKDVAHCPIMHGIKKICPAHMGNAFFYINILNFFPKVIFEYYSFILFFYL